MHEMNTTELQPATQRTERIRALLRTTSRTFALSIEGLPHPLQEQIAVSYLLLRVSDYLEDHETLDASEKVRLLGLWSSTLEEDAAVEPFHREMDRVPHGPDDPEAVVALEAPLLVRALRSFAADVKRVIVRRVCTTTSGMARWQERGPTVETEADLDDYMHHVAGVVGYLVTDLLAIEYASVDGRRAALMPLAREFGLALQCVNIIRGLRKDHERGWIYVPRALCAAYGLLKTDLFHRSEQTRAMRVVGELIRKAERHLRAGLAYVRMLPRRLHRVRLACAWPLLFAARTLAVSRDNPRVLHGEVKISRATVKRIVKNTTLFGWSNAWLSGYTDRLLRSETEPPV